MGAKTRGAGMTTDIDQAAPIQVADARQNAVAGRSEVSQPGTANAPPRLDQAALARQEHFIPVTKAALVDRLTAPGAWDSDEQSRAARRFFRYLDYWRYQTYTARLLELQQDYEVFSPDSVLLVTKTYSDAEKAVKKQRVVSDIRYVLTHANYTFVEPQDVQVILTKESFYGLDLHVDLDAFEELMIAYRGATSLTAERRKLSKFLRKEEFDVPIFRRLFVMFKLKTDEHRIADLMQKTGFSHKKAARVVRRLRKKLPKAMRDGNIYMKLFKNLPRSDLEMIFPNTQIKFKRWDKLKLGVTGSGALGAGAFGAAGKIAMLTTSPLMAVVAIAGLGGVAFRQAMNFSNQRQKYMVVMAQNLYFHSMADNRSVLSKLAERAAEEDFKEEILLYAVLAKETANRRDLPLIDRAIENFLLSKFGVELDFDVEEALERLLAEGLVTEEANGDLTTLPPDKAALHIDGHWDLFLDRLPDLPPGETYEIPDGGFGTTTTGAKAA